MKWFGKSWGAPVCSFEHIPTPVGAECFGNCGSPIAEGDRGIVTPFSGGEDDPRTEAPYHLYCFLAAVGVRPKRHLRVLEKEPSG